MDACGPFRQRPVIPRLGLQCFQNPQQSGAAGVGQIALVHRGLLQLIHQYLGQTLVRIALGNLHVPGGEVLEDRLEDVADGQGTGSRRQISAHLGRQAHGAVVDRLVAIETVLDLWRHPHRVLRRRHEAAALDIHVQHAVGCIFQRPPGMPMGGGVFVGVKIGVAEVHRRRQFAEVQQVDVFTAHAVRHQGRVVRIEV
ncbi:hypothetical protein D3C76_1167690 [compost metagenome]